MVRRPLRGGAEFGNRFEPFEDVHDGLPRADREELEVLRPPDDVGDAGTEHVVEKALLFDRLESPRVHDAVEVHDLESGREVGEPSRLQRREPGSGRKAARGPESEGAVAGRVLAFR